MPKRSPVAALLTDFGLRDHYVGVMKSVLLSACPSISIIDITHEVAPQDVQQAAYLLWASYRYLPKGTIVLCVVDPGVGSSREIIAAKTKEHVFLAPHNGALDFMLWQERVKEVTLIRQDPDGLKELNAGKISSTFHGRDIFAPLGAKLALGERLGGFGRKKNVDWVVAPFVDRANPRVAPRILQIDHFGNIITNISSALEGAQPSFGAIRVGSTTVGQWTENYASAVVGQPRLIRGSSGLVEIIMKNESAAARLQVDRTSPLELE